MLNPILIYGLPDVAGRFISVTSHAMIDCYAKDPDDNWVEIVRDVRSLSPGAVIEIDESHA